MEPVSCTAVVRPDSCEVWAPTQMQTSSQNIAARAAGVKSEALKGEITIVVLEILPHHTPAAVPSDRAPGGIGETTAPPIAPAV
jgi:hypothetical protein